MLRNRPIRIFAGQKGPEQKITSLTGSVNNVVVVVRPTKRKTEVRDAQALAWHASPSVRVAGCQELCIVGKTPACLSIIIGVFHLRFSFQGQSGLALAKTLAR